MTKKTLILFVGLMMVLLLCACDSEEVKQAKEAYANGDYAKAAELLSKEKELNQDAQDILIISEANVLYEDGKCFEAVKKLATSSEGVQAEQFDEMYQAALDESIAKHSVDNIIELLAIDESKTDAVYKTVTKACKSKDYNGFLVLDGLVKELDNGELKDKLTAFADENAVLKAQAFMIGTWEWKKDDEKTPTQVDVVEYKDDLVGKVTKVGSWLKSYSFKEDDVYWTDFQFENEEEVIFKNLVKLEVGDSVYEMTTAKINYEKNKMSIHITCSGGYNLRTPDRTWKRVED